MSYTMTETGKVLTETQDDVTFPADYRFATVNDYVHGFDRHFEDLQWLALAMAGEMENGNARTTKNYGRDDMMAVAAFRYSLGRMTYIVSDCADWLCEQWPNIAENAKKVIQRDLEEAFKRDDEARADRQDYKPLGHDCDRAQWEKVRRLW